MEIEENNKLYLRRPIAILLIATIQIFVFYSFWDSISVVLGELSKTNLFKGFGSILVGAPYAFIIWVFRNYDKQRSLEIELQKTRLEVLSHNVEKVENEYKELIENLNNKYEKEKEYLVGQIEKYRPKMTEEEKKIYINEAKMNMKLNR